MSSNKNIPQKGQGAGDPDKKQSAQSEAADVDWMIMSDISTRIGGSPAVKSSSNQSPVKSSSQISSNQDVDHDLEDLEFLRSIGLDDAIESPSSSRNTVNTSGGKATDNNEVNNIDWLIVTDLSVRKENAEIKAQPNPSYQDIGQSQTTLQPLTDNMMDGLDEDLGLNEFDFLEDSDFSDLDSLNLGISDSLSIDELQNEIDNTEGKIQGLAELLDENDDSSFDLIADVENDDWDSISGIFENDFNQLTRDPDLEIAVKSPEISDQVSAWGGATEDASENIDLGSGLFSDNNDPENLLVDNLELSDEIQSDQIVEDFEIRNDFQDDLQNEQDQDLSFDGFEVGSLESEFDSNLNDDFGVAQSLESFESNVTEDDFWSTTASNLEPESVLDESVENAFTNDWGEISENAIKDAVWDSTPNIAAELISSTSIDNAFGSSDEWESQPTIDQFEVEENIGFDLPNLASSEMESYVNFELDNVDPNLESIEPEFAAGFSSQIDPAFEQAFEQPSDQIDSELEPQIGLNIGLNEDWSTGIEANAIIGAESDRDLALEDEMIVTAPSEEADWSASLEAEIGNGNNVVWDEPLVETEDYLPPVEESSEIFNDDLLGLVDSSITESPFNEGFDFGDNLDANGWAIANNGNQIAESISESEAFDYNDISSTLDVHEQLAEQQQFTDFSEFIDHSNDDIDASLEADEFGFSENYLPASSDWENLSESIAEQATDSDYADSFAAEQSSNLGITDNFANYNESYANDSDVADNFASYADSFAPEEGLIDNFASYADSFDNDVVPQVNANLGSPNWDESDAKSSLIASNDIDNIGGILDENFDLASFDEDSLLDIPPSDFNLGSIPTTLSPNRSNTFSEDSLSGFAHQQPSIAPTDNFANNLVSQSDPFEEALANDLLNDNYEEVNFEEEALAHDLLNGLVPEADDFVSAKESPTMSTPMPSPNSNFAASTKFELGSNDRDFLDDFDLESIDPLGDSGFDDGFASIPISTGLTPPAPPIAPMPPSLPPLTKQEPTSPSISNLPPPPPFLPPLPPKRNPTQGTTPVITHPAANAGNQPLPQNRMGRRSEEDDFDRFHSQSDQHRNRSKPIDSIDESWSNLLDADTVLSGGRTSTGSSYSDINSATPPSAGKSAGRSSQGRERRERNSPSNVSRRRETGLPDFDDLGLEVHDDNTDWSGLLDSGDLSDSITTISPQSTQLPSRVRTNPIADSRFDMTGVSETKEIPRDRRKPMASFGDSTQARMGTHPDQIDFNRFTEDSYDAYSGYEQPSAPSSNTPSKPKLTIPSISLESLWQNYLKIPALGLGAIGGAFLLYSLLNRPIFDLGLRWGLFKDASGRDFTNADFKGAKLDNVDFSKAILTGAKMQDASLVGANFQGANLDGVNFTKANLNRARLIQSSVIWAEFSNAQLNLVDFAGADLARSNFVGAKMEGANLKDSKIGAQGTEKATKFSATTLLAWQIVNEPREGRNLANQDLSGLNLSFTSLKRANLTNVKLNYTDMTNTDLSGANLSGGQVNGANWSGAKLNGINLTNVQFDKNKLPKTDEETICPNGKKGPCKF